MAPQTRQQARQERESSTSTSEVAELPQLPGQYTNFLTQSELRSASESSTEPTNTGSLLPSMSTYVATPDARQTAQEKDDEFETPLQTTSRAVRRPEQQVAATNAEIARMEQVLAQRQAQIIRMQELQRMFQDSNRQLNAAAAAVHADMQPPPAAGDSDGESSVGPATQVSTISDDESITHDTTEKQSQHPLPVAQPRSAQQPQSAIYEISDDGTLADGIVHDTIAHQPEHMEWVVPKRAARATPMKLTAKELQKAFAAVILTAGTLDLRYSGDRDPIALERFLKTVEKAFRIQCIDLLSDDAALQERIVYHLAFFIKRNSDAWSWYSMVQDQTTSWSDFKEKLRSRFAAPDDRAILLNRWSSIHQGPRSYQEFASEVWTLLEALQMAGVPIHDAQVRQKLEKGANDDLRTSAGTRLFDIDDPKTLAKTLEREERLLLSVKRDNSKQARPKSWAGKTAHNETKIDTFNRKKNPIAHDTSGKKPECYVCKGKHVVRDCKDPAAEGYRKALQDAKSRKSAPRNSAIRTAGPPKAAVSCAIQSASRVTANKSFADAVKQKKDTPSSRKGSKPAASTSVEGRTELRTSPTRDVATTNERTPTKRVVAPMNALFPPTRGIEGHKADTLPAQGTSAASVTAEHTRRPGHNGRNPNGPKTRAIVTNDSDGRPPVGPTLAINVEADGNVARALCDGGSNQAFVDERFVALHDVIWQQYAKRATTQLGFRGSKGVIKGKVELPISVGGWEAGTHWFEIGACNGFDMILGTPFLHRVNAKEDWENLTISMRVDDVSITLNADRGNGRPLLASIGHCTLANEHDANATLQAVTPTEVDRTLVIQRQPARTTRSRTLEAELRTACQRNASSEEIGTMLEQYGIAIGILRPDRRLPTGLPPHRVMDDGMPLDHIIRRIDPTKSCTRRTARWPPKYATQFREKMAKYQAEGRWFPSANPDAIPTFGVPKKNPAEGRLVFDERERNANTVRDRQPLPHIDEIVQAVASAKYKSEYDVLTAYEQLRVREEDEHLTSFMTPYGQFASRVASMGDLNAPSSFQRAMNTLVTGKLGNTIRVYLDNFYITTGTTLLDHALENLWFLDRMADAEIYIGSWSFNPPDMDVLGYNVGSGTISPSARLLEKVLEAPKPTSIADVDRFLGAYQFIAEHAMPTDLERSYLADVTKHRKMKRTAKTSAAQVPPYLVDGKFVWTASHDRAWDSLVEKMNTGLELRAFRPNDDDLRTYLITDASTTGMAAYLAQGPITADWKSSWPIYCWNRRFTAAESHYSVTAQEKLAVYSGLKQFEHLLRGMEITICTDHLALISQGRGTTPPMMEGRDARWNQYIASFAPIWVHIPGKDNILADALSRVWDGYQRNVSCAIQVATNDDDEETAIWRATSSVRLSAAQRNGIVHDTIAQNASAHSDDVQNAGVTGSTLQRLEALFGNGFLEALRSALQQDRTWGDSLKHPAPYQRTIDGLLFYGERLVIPDGFVWKDKDVQIQLIHWAHQELVHAGHRRTLDLLRKGYFWTKMRMKVHRFCVECDTCQRIKPRRGKQPGWHQPMIIEGKKPWESWAHDFCGPFTENERLGVRYDSVWVRIDRFTGMVKLTPIHSTWSAEDLAMGYFMFHYPGLGHPAEILSDRDSKFTGHFWQAVHRKLKTDIKLTTAFRPQTDGEAERKMSEIAVGIRALTDARESDWVDSLPFIEFGSNASTSSSRGYAPFELLYGFIPSALPLSAGIVHDTNDEDVPAATKWVDRLRRNQNDAEDALKTARADQAATINKRRCAAAQYAPGDYVLLNSKNIRVQDLRSRKFSDRWLGPFKVVAHTGNVVQLELPEGWRIFNKFHISMLKKYHGKVPDAPLPIIEADGAEVWEVERILNRRWNTRRHRHEFLIKWKDWGVAHNTWEPEAHLAGAEQLLAAFRKQYGEDTGDLSAGQSNKALAQKGRK